MGALAHDRLCKCQAKGSDMKKIRGAPIEGPFVAMLKDTLTARAWRAMSHGARSLYICLKSRYNSKQRNNGRLHVSQREAAREIGSSFEQIARWFRELQHFGFIVMMSPGHLGLDGKGKAPHWRLTECAYMTDLPTKDFNRWNGKPFIDRKRHRKKQNPVAESRNGPLRKTAAPSLRFSATPCPPTVAESRNIQAPPTVAESRNIFS
jgi:hypothetical protein